MKIETAGYSLFAGDHHFGHGAGTIIKYVWTALLILFVSGCIPYSDSPLTKPEKACLDATVLGTWFVHDEDESVFIHVGKDGATQGLRLTMVEFDRDGEMKTSEFMGHTSYLGDKRYLNLRWARPEHGGKETKEYLFVKYTVQQKRFGISLMNSGPVKKAIHDGILQGEVVKEKWASSVKITASPEHLQGYVRDNDNVLFDEWTYLNRMDLSVAGGKTAGGEVTVVEKPEYGETVYTIGDDACQVSLTTYQSAVNRGVGHVRLKCQASYEKKMALFREVLSVALGDEDFARSFHSLFWGRLVSDMPKGSNQEMSYRLALAAHRSPLWDKERGKAKKGHENDVVVTMANNGNIYPELRDTFTAFNRLIRFSSAEKVLITAAEKLPFFDALKKHGVQAGDRLPFDCLTWFSVSMSE